MRAAIFSIIAATLIPCMGENSAFADPYTDKQRCMQLYYTNSYAKALPFCTRSAKTGNSQSQYVLGLMHLNGLGTKKNRPEAVRWLQAAAKQSYAAAHYKLDQLNDAPAPSNKALRQLADQQKRRETHLTPYASIDPAPKRIDKSPGASIAPPDDRALYQQYQTASKRGDPHARFMLGLFYLEGRSVQKNPANAARWIKMAARQGLAEAQLAMGLLYYKGYAGTAPEIEKAMYWFVRAAGQGVAEAQYSLGQIYANGINGKKNETEAAHWWHKAAVQAYAKAQHNLAVAYLNGAGVGVSRDKAMQWFIKEAEHGDPQAQFNLGRLYSEGKWFDKSGSEAANWFYQAGETWLTMQQASKASSAAKKIRQLASAQHLNIPNLFLADVLDRKIEEAN